MLVCLGPAQAVLYVGTFDPSYGAPFADLDWSGSAKFFIPDACLVGVTTAVVTCAGMTAGPADVLLESISMPSSSETLQFSQTNVAVSQANIVNGALTWVTSGFFAPELGSIAAAGGGAYEFSLRFSQDGARLFHLNLDFDKHSHQNGNGHTAHGNGNGYGHDKACPFPPSMTENNVNCGFSQTFAQVRFARVPEPGMPALLLVSLAALGLAARRRRR